MQLLARLIIQLIKLIIRMMEPGECRKTAEGTNDVRQDIHEILRQRGPVTDETLESL